MYVCIAQRTKNIHKKKDDEDEEKKKISTLFSFAGMLKNRDTKERVEK